MAKNFSDKYLNTKKGADKAYTERDAKGFTIKVWPTGLITFLFIYEVAGKRKQLNLGNRGTNIGTVTLAEARIKYNYAVTALAAGKPLVEENGSALPILPSGEVTVKTIINMYMENCNNDKGAKAWLGIKESILINKLKKWHNRPIVSISRTEAIQIVDAERKIGDGAARNLYRIAHALFEYALQRTYITTTPFYGLKKVIPFLRSVKRKRVLKTDEVTEVWRGITKGRGTKPSKRALLTILVTAQRPGEVLGMRYDEIEGDWWTIPLEKTKTKVCEQRVFLTKTAKALIGKGEGFVFPSPMRDSASGHIGTTTLSLLVGASAYYGIPHWTPHDLRRTVKTHMSRLRIDRSWSEAVLGHAKPGIVGTYDQYEYDAEKEEALLQWEAELRGLIKPTKVVMPQCEGYQDYSI